LDPKIRRIIPASFALAGIGLAFLHVA